MDVRGIPAVGLELLSQLGLGDTVWNFVTEVVEHLVLLDLTVEIATLWGEIAVGPLLEVLADGGTLGPALHALHRRQDLALGRWQRQVESDALEQEGDVGLPVLFGILRSHQVTAEVVADLARLEVVVLAGLLVIVVGEDLRPDAAHRARIGAADGVVRAEGKLGTPGERDLKGMVALGLGAEVARDLAEEEVEVQVLVALVDDDEVGVLGHAVEEETVVDHRGHTCLDAERVEQLAQRLQVERLTAAPVALVFTLPMVESRQSVAQACDSDL